MSVGGGRSLRRQIEAALSGEADPLGEDGIGRPDRSGRDVGSESDEFPAADEATPETVRRGKRGKERHIDEEVRAAYQAAQASRASASRDAAAAAGHAGGAGGSVTGARRLPDLHVLPPLLHGTGAFESLRQRLGTETGPLPGGGRHAALAAVPHGAKTFLAAALALDGGANGASGASGANLGSGAGQRLCWIARDAEIGDRVAEELQSWLGDPDAVAVLEPRTALAYERSELVRDETAARVAALALWRSGRARVLVASVQALLQHTLDPEEVPAEPRRLRIGARIHQDELLHELLALGYDPVTEVAGRGEFARRGGLVDVFPSRSVVFQEFLYRIRFEQLIHERVVVQQRIRKLAIHLTGISDSRLAVLLVPKPSKDEGTAQVPKLSGLSEW